MVEEWRDVCNGIRNTAGGCKWKYKKMAKQNESNNNNLKQKMTLETYYWVEKCISN